MTVQLADITRRELRARLARGLDTVVLPLGATEQHGEALPFGTDTVIGELVSERLATRIDGVVAPSIPYGFSLEHAAFAGTVTLGATTLVTLIKEVAGSLIEHGFRSVVLIVAHFGNSAPAQLAAAELVAETGAVVAVSNYLSGFEESVRKRIGLDAPEVDWTYFYSHAGAAEAAMVMARDPALVDLPASDRYPPDRAARFADPAMSYPHRIEEASPVGMWGDAREVSPGAGIGPTPEMGEQILDACADGLAAKFAAMSREVSLARSKSRRA